MKMGRIALRLTVSRAIQDFEVNVRQLGLTRYELGELRSVIADAVIRKELEYVDSPLRARNDHTR